MSTLSYLIKRLVCPFQSFSAFHLGNSLSAARYLWYYDLCSQSKLVKGSKSFLFLRAYPCSLLQRVFYQAGYKCAPFVVVRDVLLRTNKTPHNLRKNWRREVKKILVVLQHNKANNHTEFQCLWCSSMLNRPNVLVKYDFGELFIVITL